jgi:hypothetical protein
MAACSQAVMIEALEKDLLSKPLAEISPQDHLPNQLETSQPEIHSERNVLPSQRDFGLVCHHDHPKPTED